MMKKEKYLQIFNYLLEFSKLRSNPVRDIENSETQYPEVIWFADIPQHQLFECVTFPDYNQDADYFIKIRKPINEPIEPKFEKLSYKFKDWLNEESLTDEENLPSLKESIIRDGKTINISDFPEIEKEFQDYLNSKWIEDLEKYKNEYEIYKKELAEYNILSDTYKRFFSIYNKAQQFGEEYELIIGVGLLKFKENDNSPLISRHIFTSKIEIDFPRESFITVSPNVESEIQLETDAIIDLREQLESDCIIDAEKKCKEYLIEKNILSLFEDNIKDAIQIFADRLRSDSKFIDELNRPTEVPQKPTVYFAPSLILRKRNTRSFTALYESIIKNISEAENEIDIPAINDLVGIYDQEGFNENGNGNVNFEEENITFTDDTIYFPKKYNDEQIEIINKARKNNKILVQGPPGTGKSHTIANLICHLLANGKKILVTAYTKRALEVLKNQLPDEFRNLTVNLLSGDTASLQDLEASVNSINEELSNANLLQYKKEIENLSSELSNTKKELASSKNELIKIKEKATRQSVINKYYQGTLLEIAERIESESKSFVWYKDEYYDIENLQIIDEIKKFIPLHNKYKNIDCKIFNLNIPAKENILSPSDFKQSITLESELHQKFPERNFDYTIISDDYSELNNSVNRLYQLSLSIEQNAFPLKTELLKDYPNNTLIWNGRLNRTNELLSDLSEDELKELDRSIEISYPKDKSLIQLKNDAQTLLKYVNEGNNLSGILFNLKKSLLPRDIKEKLYFIDEVKINGSPCDTANEFQKVLIDIKFKQDFEELGKIWKTEKSNESLSYYEIFQFYHTLKNDFESLLLLLNSFREVKSKVEISSSLKIDAYDNKIIEAAREEINFNILVYKITLLKNKIDNTLIYLSDKNIHPIAQNLINDIKKVDTLTYERDLLRIDDAIIEKTDYNKYQTLQNSLKNILPNLISEIEQGIFDFSKIELLQNAIYFKHTSNELSSLLDKDYETKLNRRLIELEEKQDKLIEKIASKKSWINVIEKLNENFLLRQHLQAWVAAVKKIGKTGKGKRALKFRKIAQNEMEMCKDSVPCWIMPLYKVAETIKPEKGMYDYVIIDEASQIGPDAIFLLYISKNIIIVGDDKQVSPEYVGVDANTMTPYINLHLQNIPFKDYYGTEFSFFDHAKWFCKGMTVLREHFRCMPEIIEFSNKHFYAPDGKGLYPLKQYSENRLEPLKKVFCPNGYVEGQSQNIINKVEAEKIADTIYDLITDKKYDNKTFGVITLQGNKQSAIIESVLLKKIGEKEFHNRKIVCGNSASFQGDERDIIFLSLVTAHNHNRAALVKPEDERRFNVAVSRAKEQIWLFHSVQIEDLSNTNDLRYKLLDHFYNHKPTAIPSVKTIERKPGSQPEPFESWFEVDVYNDIVSKGFGVIPQYEVAKGRYRIDLVAILNNGIKIAIECDGDKYHDAEQLQNDLMRQRVLERCGWQFFRIRGFEYYSNRKKALEPLWDILNSNNGNKKTLSEDSFQQSTKEENLFNTENISDNINSVSQNKSIITNQTYIDSFNQNEILVFTSHQNVYKVKKKEINDRLQILENIDFEPNEKTIYMTKSNDYSGYLIVGFENGKVGKITISSYRTEFNRKKLKNAFNDESKLIFIERIENDIDLVALSSINKVVIFNTSQINPVESRTTKGVQVMKPKDGSRMIKIKKLNESKISDPNYYRKDNNLNVVGYYLKQDDKI